MSAHVYHSAICREQKACNGMEVDDLQTCGETSVEESAVWSDDKRLPVPRCGQREEVEEEVNRMHMDHVRTLDVT